MKSKILALIIALTLTILSLCSCDFLFGTVAEDGDVTVVVEESSGTYSVFEVSLENVENKGEGGKGILEYLSQRKNGLYVKMEDGGYGAFVTEIGTLKNNTDGKYILVYTSVQGDSYEGAPAFEYEGKTLYQSGVGLSSMSIEEGTVILFKLEAYAY